MLRSSSDLQRRHTQPGVGRSVLFKPSAGRRSPSRSVQKGVSLPPRSATYDALHFADCGVGLHPPHAVSDGAVAGCVARDQPAAGVWPHHLRRTTKAATTASLSGEATSLRRPTRRLSLRRLLVPDSARRPSRSGGARRCWDPYFQSSSSSAARGKGSSSDRRGLHAFEATVAAKAAGLRGA